MHLVADAPPRQLFEIKVLGLMALLAYAFFKFGWSYRLFNYCSILLGALAGARRHGPLSLVHVDGHSDFRHPGNYDSAAQLGAVAGP